MDWYLPPDDPKAVSWVRGQVTDYLRRHAEPGTDLEGAILAFSELVTNAVEHGGSPVWVSIEWTGPQPVLSVHDLGPSFHFEQPAMPEPAALRGRGLAIAADLAQDLLVRAKAAGGSAVQATLPVTRAPQESIDPSGSGRGVLPSLEEAGPEGFGRETFLRALVVQLAQEVERRQGPSQAEAAVAQVGMDVGSQMEAEYRLSRHLEGGLSPDELGDCYVRLKHAIEGDFYVLEASDTRVVLGNHRCPFGAAGRYAPALCRLTSSVFGGIAARNFGEATVTLEERIAVGDPQCRVVVELGPAPADRVGHRYVRPGSDLPADPDPPTG